MFNNASSFNQNIQNWSVSNTCLLTDMFINATSYQTTYSIGDTPLYTDFNN